jgi:hypothetical protein
MRPCKLIHRAEKGVAEGANSPSAVDRLHSAADSACQQRAVVYRPGGGGR